jgi:hypothetical protein
LATEADGKELEEEPEITDDDFEEMVRELDKEEKEMDDAEASEADDEEGGNLERDVEMIEEAMEEAIEEVSKMVKPVREVLYKVSMAFFPRALGRPSRCRLGVLLLFLLPSCRHLFFFVFWCVIASVFCFFFLLPSCRHHFFFVSWCVVPWPLKLSSRRRLGVFIPFFCFQVAAALVFFFFLLSHHRLDVIASIFFLLPFFSLI